MYLPWNTRTKHISLLLGMPFVSNTCVVKSPGIWCFRKGSYFVQYWDLGCAFIQWPHVWIYWVYNAQFIFQVVSIFFQQFTWGSSKNPVKCYSEQVKPRPSLECYGPAEVNSWEMLCKCRLHPLVINSSFPLKVNKLCYSSFLVTLNMKACHLIHPSFSFGASPLNWFRPCYQLHLYKFTETSLKSWSYFRLTQEKLSSDSALCICFLNGWWSSKPWPAFVLDLQCILYLWELIQVCTI